MTVTDTPAEQFAATADSLNHQLRPATAHRGARALALRTELANADFLGGSPQQIDNGDEARYADKSGTYTKGVLQQGIGLVDLAAYESFKHALASGDPADFANIVLGGPRTLNGPQGGLAFSLDSADSGHFSVPPAPALASEAYATELVEMYWASLLRDVAFTDYRTNATAVKAAAELTTLPSYAGPRDTGGAVTPELLFRGRFAGDTTGPYLSQFMVQPTTLGSLPITQRYHTNKAGVDFMLNDSEYLKVQNGQPTGKKLNQLAPLRYLHDGRGLAAYTHADVLYQAYFIAYLVLNTINAGNPVPLNPGNPYATGHPAAKTQNGFASLGQPDIAATLAAVADEALKAVWYQKWWVHLRHRPESGGAIVHLLKTGQGGSIQGHVSDTALNSQAVASSFAANNSYFLAQAFPEGSPAHPAYPTGHGTVAGACITVLKFFFDGNFVITNPVVSSPDGTSTTPYMAPAGEAPLTVNGELNKLANNVSFGHGVHAGIHWRSDTETSIELGEAVALSYLRERARTYNEQFTVSLTKLDGSIATISNP
ncbi:vanadium-dependent haloperoxidase [Mycobacterium paraterrae]|uniref:Vanadium-dependent haloperoxidase n=1 Tax=Mycobacterium paraterrae TaxID=577492 RepID=A0ABY3VM84_9MYCO|nr:vanadium-dependent haloperoxidase [Mycobacterium paraterrae]UMB69260.1 vanadium-dependent haloperoxidase [Mycobacterium paraterrae]